MLRVSKDELIERWALTYRQDGYEVRNDHLAGRHLKRPESAITPALEATKKGQCVLVYIIDSPEAMDEESTREELQALSRACGNGAKLHVVVAAECAHVVKERLDGWDVHADLVHVT